MRKRSVEGQAYQHLYKTARWKRLSAKKKKLHPMCQCPHCREQKLPTTVVHHIEPHKGDTRKFFDWNNLQSMNKECHDRFAQSEEKGGHGFNQGSDATGQPLNRDSEWYAN